jgi:uncharacterized protein (DUF2147 family)
MRRLYNTTRLADTRLLGKPEGRAHHRAGTVSMLRFAVSLMLVAFGVTAGASASRAMELDGFWMDSHGEVVLQVSSCGDAMCAKVVWLRLPYGPDRLPLKDFRNPEASLQNRQVCGLRVIEGFTKQPDGTWGGGDVYVPDLGMSFKGYATVLNPQEIEVRGYVFLPLFGSTEVWKRVPKPAYHCEKDGVPPAPPLPKE